MSYCGSIPGTCGHKETCLDTLCEGHPANHLGGGQPMAFYPMALHRIPELSEAHKRGFVAPREMEEDKTEPSSGLGSVIAWVLASALSVGGAAAVVIAYLRT